MIQIIVPTCKASVNSVRNQIIQTSGIKPIVTCKAVSAPTNRNFGLSIALKNCKQDGNDIIIMCDDDIKGFYEGWVNDLTKPFFDDKDLVMISARLMHDNNTPGVMMDIVPDLSVDVQYVETRALPSACIAFKWDCRIWFDESFSVNNKGSGFEDLDFCWQINARNKNSKYAIANKCKLIHKNEQKNQGSYMQIFHQKFKRKWGLD